MQDVKDWLNSKPYNYEKGVRIYLQYNRDPLIIALFREDETDFKRQRLIGLMQAFSEKVNTLQPASPASLKPILQDLSPISHKGWPNPITDPVIQALWEQWRPIYARMMTLQAQVYEVACQGEQGNTYKSIEAGQMALEILSLDEQCDEFYAKREYYQRYGRLPDTQQVEEVLIVDPIKWITQLKNAERYVRDYRLKLKNDPDNKNAHKWATKLNQYQAEVAYYKKLLKLDDGKDQC